MWLVRRPFAVAVFVALPVASGKPPDKNPRKERKWGPLIHMHILIYVHTYIHTYIYMHAIAAMLSVRVSSLVFVERINERITQ